MSKHLMLSRSEFETWLRRCRVAVIAFVGLILLVGAVYIVSKLIGAQFAPLFVGLIATIAGCALGAVAWGGLWLADLVVSQGEQVERQRERIAQLEADLQLQEAEAEARAQDALAQADVTPPPVVAPVAPYPRIAPVREEPEPEPVVADDALAASTTQEERFCAALASGDLRSANSLWRDLNGHVVGERREALKVQLDALRAQVAARLRREFADLLHAQDYTGALRKGDEIADIMPTSRMRSDFDVIRPHLEARAAQS